MLSKWSPRWRARVRVGGGGGCNSLRPRGEQESQIVVPEVTHLRRELSHPWIRRTFSRSRAGTTLLGPDLLSSGQGPGAIREKRTERKRMGYFCLYPDLGMICGTSLVFRFGNFPVGENWTWHCLQSQEARTQGRQTQGHFPRARLGLPQVLLSSALWRVLGEVATGGVEGGSGFPRQPPGRCDPGLLLDLI